MPPKGGGVASKIAVLEEGLEYASLRIQALESTVKRLSKKVFPETSGKQTMADKLRDNEKNEKASRKGKQRQPSPSPPKRKEKKRQPSPSPPKRKGKRKREPSPSPPKLQDKKAPSSPRPRVEEDPPAKMAKDQPKAKDDAPALAAASPAVASAPAVAGVDAADSVLVVADPGLEHRCYDVLGIPPSATVDEVKRAFKKRALKAHPDKQGGDQATFLCLNKAYEMLSDESKRAKYDSELQMLGSADGATFLTATPAVPTDTAEQLDASPEMVSKLFLEIDPKKWPGQFDILNNKNLLLLVQYLQDPPEQAFAKKHRGEDDKPAGKSVSVPGLIKNGQRYRGKIVWNHILVQSVAEELDAALEARMALGTLQAAVGKLVADGTSFEDALRQSSARLREKEQHSSFYIAYAFDFRPRQIRVQTPMVVDIEQMLEYRATLLKILETESGADRLAAATKKAHGNIAAEVQRVKMRQNANKKQLLSQLLDEACAEVGRRGLQMPTGAAPKRLAARPVPVPAAEIKQFKVVGPNKVGVLVRPDPEMAAIEYVQSGATFGVSMTHITGGRKFFQLSDGRGWVPHCSRKDPSKIVVDQHDGTVDLLAIEDDEKGTDSDVSSDSGSSSSSSSSSS